MPRGKAKGSAYERRIAKVLAKAFCKLGVTEKDCYRTNRGSKEGDLFLGSALLKLFAPFGTIECKHYKKVNYDQFFTRYEKMRKSWLFKRWWEQLEAEVLITKKPGLLIFRQNNGLDLCAFYIKHLSNEMLRRFKKMGRTEVAHNSGVIWILPLSQFLWVAASERSKELDNEVD